MWGGYSHNRKREEREESERVKDGKGRRMKKRRGGGKRKSGRGKGKSGRGEGREEERGGEGGGEWGSVSSSSMCGSLRIVFHYIQPMYFERMNELTGCTLSLY